MSEEKKNPPANEEDFLKKNMGAQSLDMLIVSHRPENIKKSRVSQLFAVLPPYNGPDNRGNYFAVCPWCNSSHFNFNIERWIFFCYTCKRGKHLNLSDLMNHLRLEHDNE